jgi:hypothetical protein
MFLSGMVSRLSRATDNVGPRSNLDFPLQFPVAMVQAEIRFTACPGETFDVFPTGDGYVVRMFEDGEYVENI